jgi:ADP-ribose pyrophosphatase
MKKIPQLEEREVVLDAYFQVIKDRLNSGEEGEDPYTYYSIGLQKYAVMAIALTEENRLIVNYEYRHPCEETLLGLPGGQVDEGEDPIEAGKRELLEETGYQGESAKEIGRCYPFPGISGQEIVYVLIEKARKVSEPKLEPGEVLKTAEIELDELSRMIGRGVPIDGIMLTGLFYLRTPISTYSK